MNVEAVEHVLRRCIYLLQRPDGTTKVKQEYHYWIDWLKNQFKQYKKIQDTKTKNMLEKLVMKSKDLYDDIGYVF